MVNLLVVTCKPNGIIKQIIRNDFADELEETIGHQFSSLFVPEDTGNALTLIRLINQNLLAHDYYLRLNIPHSQVKLSLRGAKVNDELVIIGSDNHLDTSQFIEELQRVNNSQANTIRALSKVVAAPFHVIKQNDEIQKLFNEITRINNELVNAQRELSRKRIELERLNELKNSFLGMAAHDLRNPLGVILSYAEYIREETGTSLTDAQKWMLEVIQHSASFMLELIDNLLDINKIESGKLELNKEVVDLVRKVEDWAKANGALASRKSIALHYTASSNSILVECDINKIEQVFNNLVSNAIKFSFPGSSIYVSLETNTNSVILSVKDQGIGMSTEQINRLFKPFSRISAEGTAGEKCTGLGLYIVKRIIEGHGGNVYVLSTPGKGTEFRVALPLSDQLNEHR